MRKSSEHNRAKPEAQEPEGNPLRCAANGCVILGSIASTPGGRLRCCVHWGVEPRHWDRVTTAIRQHEAALIYARRLSNAKIGSPIPSSARKIAAELGLDVPVGIGPDGTARQFAAWLERELIDICVPEELRASALASQPHLTEATP